MKRTLKIVLPVAVFAAGLGAVALLFATAPDVTERVPEAVAPAVEVAPVNVTRHRMRVRTQGTVSARTESDLVPQVSGKAVWVSPRLVSGGFFEEGEVLIEIEPADYEVARERARAALARAESEHVRADKELERLRGLIKTGVASQAQLDDVERAERVTAATLREARAALEQAERDLDRTRLRAPFTGRVRRETVDVGQFVSRGAPVAHLYAIDRAEVRLPIADAELAFIDVPLLSRSGLPPAENPEVVLRAEFAGREQEWRGHVVRTEGEIDTRSRLVNLVAAVDDPYGDNDGAPPLAVGLFVEAEILGRTVDEVVVVPRAAMRDRDHVLVVDADDRLRMRRADVIRRERRDVVLAAKTFARGDRIVTSAIETAVDGMRVRPAMRNNAAVATAAAGAH
ncbi:efflux RND transporter periplasmic adaptor subunit [Candidatus Binatia bacterium]|nr:efflux RND transporter periplasmic adaptor subunit [Candidatus Binatia bacterium]